MERVDKGKRRGRGGGRGEGVGQGREECEGGRRDEGQRLLCLDKSPSWKRHVQIKVPK